MGVILNPKQEIVAGCHFVWAEYATLREWNKLAQPTEAEYKNAVFLFIHLRDLIRLPLGKPLTISSGARTLPYTHYLKGKGVKAGTQSAHIEWKAVDLYPPEGMTARQFWDWCGARWPGRMENWWATPTWVHLDTRQWGRRVRFDP